MNNLENVVYLSEAQYAKLVEDGTITVGTKTVTYNEDDLYITPKSEYDAKIDTGTSTTIVLTHNTEYRRGELATLELTLPTTTPTEFISSVVFTSGTTATELTAPETIKWTGDGTSNNEFTPEASKTYNLMIWNDGTNINGIARGV